MSTLQAPPLALPTLGGASEFRAVMSRFATGVTVVTSRNGPDVHGMTCNAVCSISPEPPTILVSLTARTRTERLVKTGGVFAVNILGEGQTALSDRFAGRDKHKEEDRFDGFPWRVMATGAPIFEGVLAYLDCRVISTIDGGDHTLCLGQVLAASADEDVAPLLFFRSRYQAIARRGP